MRDFLSYDPKTTEPDHLPDRLADPMARIRDHAGLDLPKRFYQDVTTVAGAGGWSVLLDGRPVKTPAKRPLVLPRAAIAEAVAAEWRAQGERIDPRSMTHTRLANSVVDGVVDRRDEVAADAARYAGSDLLSYRADGPERLVARQTELWDPVLDWVEERFRARFLVAEGVMHVAQDPEALAAVAAAIAPLDPWRLAGIHSLTTISGSVLIALAHLEGRLDLEAAWTAATVDDAWNMELWGRDEEAVARLSARRREFDAASLFVRAADDA